MIITANGTAHTVNVSSKFTPKFIRKIKFFKSFNGKTQVSDRGASEDKYVCSFIVLDDIEKVNNLANDLDLNKSQITIDTLGFKMFGSGLDHSSPFTCNLQSKISYPIRDLLTATLKIDVVIVSAINYDLTIPAILPEFLYKWPIERVIEAQKSSYNSTAFGDFGVITRVNSAGDPLKFETASFKFKIRDSEFAKIHRYLAEQRGSTITINTNLCLELFLNSTSTEVKVIEFSYSPNGFNFWNVSLTLDNNV